MFLPLPLHSSQTPQKFPTMTIPAHPCMTLWWWRKTLASQILPCMMTLPLHVRCISLARASLLLENFLPLSRRRPGTPTKIVSACVLRPSRFRAATRIIRWLSQRQNSVLSYVRHWQRACTKRKGEPQDLFLEKLHARTDLNKEERKENSQKQAREGRQEANQRIIGVTSESRKSVANPKDERDRKSYGKDDERAAGAKICAKLTMETPTLPRLENSSAKLTWRPSVLITFDFN